MASVHVSPCEEGCKASVPVSCSVRGMASVSVSSIKECMAFVSLHLSEGVASLSIVKVKEAWPLFLSEQVSRWL